MPRCLLGPAMTRRTLILAAFALVCVACRSPELTGSRRETEHYRVQVATDDPAFAEGVAGATERIHAFLEALFKTRPDDKAQVLVARGFDDYGAIRRVEGSAGEYQSAWYWSQPVICVHWKSEREGMEVLAHEMVHHFVAAALPDLPAWKNEGLARALDGSRDPLPRLLLTDPEAPERVLDTLTWRQPTHLVDLLKSFDDDSIRERLAELGALGAHDDEFIDRLLIGSLVTFGFETRAWSSWTEFETWEPDQAAFLTWLRSEPLFRAKETPSVLEVFRAEGPGFLGPERVAARPPRFLGAEAANERVRVLHASAEPDKARQVAELARRYAERLRSYLPEESLPTTPLHLYVFDDPRAFQREAERYGVEDAIWLPLPGRAGKRLALFDGSVLDKDAGRRKLLELIINDLARASLGETPNWFRAGLIEALNHGQDLTERNPFRCPVSRSHPKAKDRSLRILLQATLAYPPGELHEDERFMAGLMVRFGCETEGWSRLDQARGWAPNPEAFIKWYRSVDRRDFQQHHRRFAPILERPGSTTHALREAPEAAGG